MEQGDHGHEHSLELIRPQPAMHPSSRALTLATSRARVRREGARNGWEPPPAGRRTNGFPRI